MSFRIKFDAKIYILGHDKPAALQIVKEEYEINPDEDLNRDVYIFHFATHLVYGTK